MAEKDRYVVLMTAAAIRHLDEVELKHHAMIRDVMEQQLTNRPEVGTRNRKRLKREAFFGAAWEVRCGPQNRFRIFYNIDVDERVVNVLAIGIKVKNRLYVGGDEVEQ